MEIIMWARLLNILKYVWQNPVVQFACFTVIEGLYLILRKKSGRSFSQYRMEKKSSPDVNEAIADMIVGNDNKEQEPEKEVVAEEAKPKKARCKKKEVVLEEEPKPKKTRKRTVKKLEEGDKVAEAKPKRRRVTKRVTVKKEEEPSTEEKN
jgi:hypothetical protein